MPDFNDPFVLAFYTEAYEKEKRTRLKWLNEYIKSIDKQKFDNKSRKLFDKFIKEYKILHGKHHDEKKIKNDKDVIVRTKINGIKPSVMKILVNSEEGKGREAFLTEIYKQNPNERHNYPMCTSWDYGWSLRDNHHDTIERRGRVAIMNSTFFQRTGLAPDPEHYNTPTSFQ